MLVLDYENQVQPIRLLSCELMHNSYKIFSCFVMAMLCEDIRSEPQVHSKRHLLRIFVLTLTRKDVIDDNGNKGLI